MMKIKKKKEKLKRSSHKKTLSLDKYFQILQTEIEEAALTYQKGHIEKEKYDE